MVKRFCFGPTAVFERAILPIKPSAIAGELQEEKNETNASNCATEEAQKIDEELQEVFSQSEE